MTRKTRRPIQAAGTAIIRAYQPMGALSGTPESGLPQGNGTTMGRAAGRPLRNQPWVSPASGASNWNCHGPFRFCQSSRWKSGRGCSGRGMRAGRASWLGRCKDRAADAARTANAENQRLVIMPLRYGGKYEWRVRAYSVNFGGNEIETVRLVCATDL